MEMSGYTKLFSSIVTSTIWREPNEVRIVWITMLALANKDGEVHASIPGLADMARVSIEQCEMSLTVLESPDKYSRTKDYEGRRIEAMQGDQGGWRLLNHPKYRRLMSSEERREYFRIKKAEQRAKAKIVSTKSTIVKDGQGQSDQSPPSPHIAEAKGREQKQFSQEGESQEMAADRIANLYPKPGDLPSARETILRRLEAGERADVMTANVLKCIDAMKRAPTGTANQFWPKVDKFFRENNDRSPEEFEARTVKLLKETMDGNGSTPRVTGTINQPGRYKSTLKP